MNLPAATEEPIWRVGLTRVIAAYPGREIGFSGAPQLPRAGGKTKSRKADPPHRWAGWLRSRIADWWLEVAIELVICRGLTKTRCSTFSRHSRHPAKRGFSREIYCLSGHQMGRGPGYHRGVRLVGVPDRREKRLSPTNRLRLVDKHAPRGGVSDTKQFIIPPRTGTSRFFVRGRKEVAGKNPSPPWVLLFF